MKIDFLIGDNPYQSTGHFAEKFAEALRREQAEVRLFDIRNGRFYQAFYAIFQDPPDVTCSFSDITVGENLLLGEQWQIPHISFLIDPAIYFLHHLRGCFSLVTCVDVEDCEFVRKLQFPHVCFLPHGVDREIVDREEKRPYDVAMLGTCTDYEQVRADWREKFSPITVKILEEAAERVLSPEGVSSLQALLEAGVEENLPLVHHELDLYIGGKDRIELLRAFTDVPIHIWGKGPWRKFFPKAQILRPLSFVKTLDVMQKTKILLNSSPRFKQGSHERIFHGLLSGALVMTGKNAYVDAHFKQGDLLTYSHGHWAESIPEAMTCLENPTLRKEIVSRGSAIVRKEHTWDHRARTLMSWLRQTL